MTDLRPGQSEPARPETVALFVSDVHLQSAMPKTRAAFLDFLRLHAVHSPRLYLLGDLFEYWAGDDDLEEDFHHDITQALGHVSQRGTEIFWIPGNRDFLVGEAFAHSAGLQLRAEPLIESLAGKRVVLVHGDAQCTDDHAYMAFRQQVRSSAWQAGFLAQPLSQRKALIANMRAGSRAAQQAKSMEIMDVNANAIAALFADTGADLLIHGHTHRPQSHPSADGKRVRHVLPDWDCDTQPVRGGWLALLADGSVQRHSVFGAVDDA